MAATLGVTEPYSCGIGGGGFFVFHHARSGRTYTINGRETAPRAYASDEFADEDGEALDFDEVVNSGKSIGVPGTVATWDVADRPSSLELDPATRWLGLEVREVKNLGPDAAEVEFIARYREAGQAGRAVRLRERSRFRCADGRWRYAGGEMRERKT